MSDDDGYSDYFNAAEAAGVGQASQLSEYALDEWTDEELAALEVRLARKRPLGFAAPAPRTRRDRWGFRD